MKNIFKHTFTRVILSASLLVAFGCQRDISELEPAEYSKNPEVFIDAFSSGLNYSAFGG
jgi:hypothetical protein